MSTITLQLSRNLRKSILQGDPWIYLQSLQLKDKPSRPTLCKVVDAKRDFVCWGFFSPNSPLAVRVLSLDKNPPGQSFFEMLLEKAYKLRSSLNREHTNSFRLINGEGDLLPGIVCDVYAETAVLQFDGVGPFEFWDQDWLANWILKNTHCKTVFHKARHDLGVESKTWGAPLESTVIVAKENDCLFYVDIEEGQKTGFFLDQRENRNYIKEFSKDKTVMNLFSYSGGFSIYAGVGGARRVVSVDIAQGSLDFAQKNWALNKLIPARHETLCTDVFEFIRKCKENFDIVICDPPSLAKSEKQKELAIQKYIDCFSAAAKRVHSNGHLVLSSCSSHISCEDFNQIIAATLSKARRRGQILKVSGQGADHPYPHACPHLRYLKFVDLVIYE